MAEGKDGLVLGSRPQNDPGRCTDVGLRCAGLLLLEVESSASPPALYCSVLFCAVQTPPRPVFVSPSNLSCYPTPVVCVCVCDHCGLGLIHRISFMPETPTLRWRKLLKERMREQRIETWQCETGVAGAPPP